MKLSGLSTKLRGKLHNDPGKPMLNADKDFKSKYKLGNELAQVVPGVSFEASGPSGKVAVKIILKKYVRDNEQGIRDEISLWKSLDHPYIVQFHEWFETKHKFYIVTDLPSGGELFEQICKRGQIPEQEAVKIVREMLEAVHYLHRHNIVHRDIKPENFRYRASDSDSPVMLTDFSYAKIIRTPGQILKSIAGSFGYAAPEICREKPHGKPADMWSIGVTTYTILAGYSPWRSEQLHELIKEFEHTGVVFHERYWADVSQDAKDFVSQLLQFQPTRRLTSKEALQHTWMSGEPRRVAGNSGEGASRLPHTTDEPEIRVPPSSQSLSFD